MIEQPHDESNAAMVSADTEEVIGLYLGDQLALTLETPQAQRDLAWREVSGNSLFSGKIAGLRAALKTADITRRAYPVVVATVLGRNFSGIPDDEAKNLLTDLLTARLSTPAGNLRGVQGAAIEEVKRMKTELGIGNGLQANSMEGLTLEGVVKKILIGDLKLPNQG